MWHVTTFNSSLSISPTGCLALCGWWRWCESRQMGLAARQQAVIPCVCFWICFPWLPCAILLPCSLHICLLHPSLTNITCPMYYFPLTKHFLSESFLISLPFLPLPPPLHSSTQCHNGPTLMEAFIKCQLYTRDHTVDTVISDPKRSTCLWPFSSCWRAVCLICGCGRLFKDFWPKAEQKNNLSKCVKKWKNILQ